MAKNLRRRMSSRNTSKMQEMNKKFGSCSKKKKGDSAQTPWLLCKLKFYSLEKPVGSLKGRLKITVAINKMIKKKKYFPIHI